MRVYLDLQWWTKLMELWTSSEYAFVKFYKSSCTLTKNKLHYENGSMNNSGIRYIFVQVYYT